MIRRQDVWPLGSIAFILAVTLGWWTLALWSVPGAPDWLERTRSVCFNLTESGLPDASGWLLLFGQPPTMLAVLLAGWRSEVATSLRRLSAGRGGRITMGATAGLVLAGMVLAGARVADAALPAVEWGTGIAAPSAPPRLDRPWPELPALVDQRGESFDRSDLGSRPALITFAFGHCETLCPVVVQAARAARESLGGDWATVVLTLDPWRDTPARLESLERGFGLDPSRDFVVGAEVADVEAALDAWKVARTRDPRTGDVTHPGLVYLVDRSGIVVYLATGGVDQLVALGRLIDG